jgi:hypothetical protein
LDKGDVKLHGKVPIDQPDVIEKILTHLGLWPRTVHAPPAAAVA